MTLREYLVREAKAITDRALVSFTDADAWRRLLPEYKRKFIEMTLPTELPPYADRPPLNVQVTGVVERPAYRIEKLYYESLPKLYVTANLYVPNQIAGRAPAVLYQCGHAEKQKVHYQAHPRRFAELGFVCLLIETVQLGESAGYHHGPYREGWFHWYSRGYTPAGIEMLNAMRGLDLLAQRPDVDADRLGATGNSGGGAGTWWLAAADDRVKAAAPACGTATLESHIADRTIDGHCDCMWWINTHGWDLADVGALIAPRPLMIASANRDAINTIASIRRVHQQLERLYGMLGAGENLKLIETPGPHGYHERSRTAIFSWFLKHLQGKDVPPERVGDIDASPEKKESEETLRVFLHGSPPGNRTPTIHDDLFKPPALPALKDTAAVRAERERVAAALRESTFAFFPEQPTPLDLRIESEFEYPTVRGTLFSFESEPGLRLKGRLTVAPSVERPHPVVVAVRSPGEDRDAAEQFVGRLRVPWARAVVEPRGTGETSYGEELQWHLRRAAAWTGRTLAAMRVYDILRALEAVRGLPDADATRVSLAARGEMAAAALYAALLDGRVQSLFLESPPAIQNAPSRPDGRGPAIEMLSCLRVTDLPQVAGLLYPTELVFTGDLPPTYEWATKVYRDLGPPGHLHLVCDLSSWHAQT